MEILLVTHRFPPYAGGVETHVSELAVRYAARGHDVTVLSADADGRWGAHPNEVPIRRFRSIHPGDAFYVAPQIALAVWNADPDVVHAHNYHALPAWFASLGVSEARFVVTPHYHGGSANGLRDRILSFYRPLGRWMLRRADAVIAVSEWERDRLRADHGVEATVVPNGVRRERFADAEPEQRSRPYLLCVGRLEEYKGIQTVVRALPALPEYDLVVAGTGPYRSRLEEITGEAGVEDRVSLLGFVDEDRLPELYAGSVAHLQLSSFEAYGMTVAESLAAGTPAVVRRAGALTDWTDSQGVVSVDGTNPETVAAAVRAAITGPQPDPYSVPDWSEVVDRVLAVYRSRPAGD